MVNAGAEWTLSGKKYKGGKEGDPKKTKVLFEKGRVNSTS